MTTAANLTSAVALRGRAVVCAVRQAKIVARQRWTPAKKTLLHPLSLGLLMSNLLKSTHQRCNDLAKNAYQPNEQALAYKASFVASILGLNPIEAEGLI